MQVGRAFRHGLHPREPEPEAVLPDKHLVFAWQMEFRSAIKMLWEEIADEQQAAQAAGSKAPLIKDEDACMEKFTQSVLTDMLVSYMPPIRGSCLRTLQVGGQTQQPALSAHATPQPRHC